MQIKTNTKKIIEKLIQLLIKEIVMLVLVRKIYQNHVIVIKILNLKKLLENNFKKT